MPDCEGTLNILPQVLPFLCGAVWSFFEGREAIEGCGSLGHGSSRARLGSARLGSRGSARLSGAARTTEQGSDVLAWKFQVQ